MADLLEQGKDPKKVAQSSGRPVHGGGRTRGDRIDTTNIPAPDWTIMDEPDIKELEFPKTRLEGIKAPADAGAVHVEDFRGWTFEEAYAAFRDVDNDVSRGTSTLWRSLASDLLAHVTRFEQDLMKLEADDGWRGETHDAVIDNVTKSLAEPIAAANGAAALSVLLEAFATTMATTKNYIVGIEPSYRDSLARWPRHADLVRQGYSTVAQNALNTVYAPMITQIAASNPGFTSGKQPELNELPPPPPPSPPDLDNLRAGGGGDDPPNLRDLLNDGRGGPDAANLPDLSNLGGADGTNLPDLSNLGGADGTNLPDLSNLGGADGTNLPDLSRLGLSNTGGPNGVDAPDLSRLGDLNNAGGGGSGPGLNLPGGPRPPGTDLSGVGDPSGPRPPGSIGVPPPPPNLDDLLNNGPLAPGTGLGRNPAGASGGPPGAAKNPLNNPALSSALGPVNDAVKQAMSAAQKPANGAIPASPGVDPKGFAGLPDPDTAAAAPGRPDLAATGGGPGGAAGAGGPRVGGAPLGAPVASMSAGPVGMPADLVARAGLADQLGAAPGAMGAGGMPMGGGAPGVGQRGQTDKDHKANKALRGRQNGEDIFGEVDAVVPVIGGDQEDQRTPLEEGDQPRRQRPATRGSQPQPVARGGSDTRPIQPSAGS
ncbi:hypothetical protein [Mycolicibacterium sp.]|uniref:hypothetical protein n=1 Tax=Mycolicibacterium sp. TaxID=2320850 RepID=UPI003D12E12E